MYTQTRRPVQSIIPNFCDQRDINKGRYNRGSYLQEQWTGNRIKSLVNIYNQFAFVKEHFPIRCNVNKFAKEREELFELISFILLVDSYKHHYLNIIYLIYRHLYYYCNNNHILKLHSKIQNVFILMDCLENQQYI